MMITIEAGGQLLPLLAPIGAAGYFYETNGSKLSILFAMMRKGERGIDALQRVRKDNSNLKWIPASARPEEQHHMLVGLKDFVAFDFEYRDGTWTPVQAELVDFMEQMSRLAAVPSQAPKVTYTDLASWSRRGETSRESI